MEDFKFGTKEELQNSVNNFYKLPMRSRNIIANKIHNRLKELDEFVKVYGENPILNYPSERFIIMDRKSSDNEYSSYANYLNENEIEKFNSIVYNDMELSLNKFTGVYDVVGFCKEQNNKADELYLSKYPSHEDLINVFKKAVSSIELCFLYELAENRARQSMDDVEFVISTNILTESHVRRLLLSIIKLLNMPIFKSRFNDLKPRLNSLFNSRIQLAKQRVDDFTLARPFNDSALQAYLKIQKIGHEETLVQSYYNGDYSITDKVFNVDVNLMVMIDEYVQANHHKLKLIDMIDKFKLEQNGLTPILNKMYKGKDYYMHCKNGIQYLLYKSIKFEDVYYMITKINDENRFKSYRITLNESNTFLDKMTSSAMLESTFITNYKMMNRK